MSSDNIKPPLRNAAFDKDYGQIWQEFLARALNAGYTVDEAARSHRRWKSIGKQLKAGRY